MTRLCVNCATGEVKSGKAIADDREVTALSAGVRSDDLVAVLKSKGVISDVDIEQAVAARVSEKRV
jgi:hypothetical protein